MDDDELRALLRRAADGPAPPAAFGYQDVRAGAQRAARRRGGWALGSAAAAVVVALLGVALLTGPGGTGEESGAAGLPSSAAATPSTPPTPSPRTGTRSVDPPAPVPTEDALPEAEKAGPQVAGGGGCRVDVGAYRALAQVVPGLVRQPPFPVTGGCAEGESGAGVLVRDGPTAGTLEVRLVPAGRAARPLPEEVAARGPSVAVDVADGRTVVLQSVAATDAGPPFAASLPELAADLAAALG